MGVIIKKKKNLINIDILDKQFKLNNTYKYVKDFFV